VSTLLLKFDYSAIQVEDYESEDAPIGRGLYRLCSCTRHSCVPNLAIHCLNTKDGYVELRAIRDIAVGDELTLNWLPNRIFLSSIHDVNKQLLESYGTVCRCSRCTSPDHCRTLLCKNENCLGEMLSRVPHREWTCDVCSTKFKKNDLKFLIQRENELSLSAIGLRTLLESQTINKLAFERNLKELLQKCMHVVGKNHYAKPITHLVAGEWCNAKKNNVQAALHFIEYTKTYENLYPNVPTISVAVLYRRIVQLTTGLKEKLFYAKRAAWAFAICCGEKSRNTKDAIKILDDLESKSTEEFVDDAQVEAPNLEENDEKEPVGGTKQP